MPNTTKHDLIMDAWFKHRFLSQSDISTALETMLSVITKKLAAGKTISIRGLGTIYPVIRPTKGARNVHAGSAVSVKAHKTVKIRFAKEILNG